MTIMHLSIEMRGIDHSHQAYVLNLNWYHFLGYVRIRPYIFQRVITWPLGVLDVLYNWNDDYTMVFYHYRKRHERISFTCINVGGKFKVGSHVYPILSKVIKFVLVKCYLLCTCSVHYLKMYRTCTLLHIFTEIDYHPTHSPSQNNKNHCVPFLCVRQHFFPRMIFY